MGRWGDEANGMKRRAIRRARGAVQRGEVCFWREEQKGRGAEGQRGRGAKEQRSGPD
jgi:hypothetical protein